MGGMRAEGTMMDSTERRGGGGGGGVGQCRHLAGGGAGVGHLVTMTKKERVTCVK